MLMDYPGILHPQRTLEDVYHIDIKLSKKFVRKYNKKNTLHSFYY